MSRYNILSIDAPTITVTASTTPTAVQLPFTDEYLYFVNGTTGVVFVQTGTSSTTTAAVPAGGQGNTPIPAGSGSTIRLPRYPLAPGVFPYISVYGATSGPCYVTVAQGI